MNWEQGQLKHWLCRNDSGTWGDEPIGHGDVEVLRSTDIALDGSWVIEDPAVRSVPERERLRKTLAVHDLVVVTSSGSEAHLGKTAIVNRAVAEREALFANFVQRLTASPSADPRYVRYFLTSKVASEEMAALGNTTTGLRNLNGGIIAALTFPGPPLEEQRAIADYLDAETARIDALITKKQQLSEVLEARWAETRSRLIWQRTAARTRLKFLCGLPTSGNRDHGSFTDDDAGVPCLRGLNIRPGRIRMQDLRYVSPEEHRKMRTTQLAAGDVVIVRSGLAGSAVAIREDLQPCNCVDLVVVRRSDIAAPLFIEHAINSREAQQQVTQDSAGALLTHFNAVDAGNLQIPDLPLTEQQSVVSDLESERVSHEGLIRVLRKQTDLLRERRQAIVTAAVVGDLSVPLAI